MGGRGEGVGVIGDGSGNDAAAAAPAHNRCHVGNRVRTPPNNNTTTRSNTNRPAGHQKTITRNNPAAHEHGDTMGRWVNSMCNSYVTTSTLPELFLEEVDPDRLLVVICVNTLAIPGVTILQDTGRVRHR